MGKRAGWILVICNQGIYTSAKVQKALRAGCARKGQEPDSYTLKRKDWYKMNDLVMIIFIGIQASGKTTFYQNHFKGTYEHVSLDVLNTRNKERLAIEQCIEQKKSLVIDNTNPTREDREKYITMAKANQYQVIGYYFESSIGKCIERNEKRSGKAKVPRCAVISTSKKLELPDWEEGFDKLYYVHLEDSEMKVEDWRDEDEI